MELIMLLIIVFLVSQTALLLFIKKGAIKRAFTTTQKTPCFTSPVPQTQASPQSATVNKKPPCTRHRFNWKDLGKLYFQLENAVNINEQLDTELLTQCPQSVQKRLLPTINTPLKAISLDKKRFSWGNVFAKPDAVFATEHQQESYVVEYKTRQRPQLFTGIAPSHVLQVIISAWVYKQQMQSAPTSHRIRSFIRYSNGVLEIKHWEKLIPFIEEHVDTYFDVTGNASVSASDLAWFIYVTSPVFKYQPKNKEEAALKGKALHFRIMR